jgi:hypothetical protein
MPSQIAFEEPIQALAMLICRAQRKNAVANNARPVNYQSQPVFKGSAHTSKQNVAGQRQSGVLRYSLSHSSPKRKALGHDPHGVLA